MKILQLFFAKIRRECNNTLLILVNELSTLTDSNSSVRDVDRPSSELRCARTVSRLSTYGVPFPAQTKPPPVLTGYIELERCAPKWPKGASVTVKDREKKFLID